MYTYVYIYIFSKETPEKPRTLDFLFLHVCKVVLIILTLLSIPK